MQVALALPNEDPTTMSYALAVMLSLSLGTVDPGTDAPLVPGSIALDETGRYDSPRSYDDTVDYYRRYFRSRGSARWRNIVNLPSIKAKHIQNTAKKALWDGINIYEHRGRVRIFVIPKSPAPDATP